MPVTPYFIPDIQIGISKVPETAINVPYELAAEFDGILVDSVVPYVPNLNLINDDDQVGDGTEFAKNPRPYNWTGSAVTLSSKMNTEFMAVMLRRFLGGVVTNTSPAAGVYDHAIVMQLRTARVPLMSTLAMILGGADVILASMAVDKFTISQSRTEEPRASVDLMGSGFHKRFSDSNSVQVLTGAGVTSGTYTLTFRGQTTSALAFGANAAAVQTALEALNNVAPAGADLVVSGTDIATGLTVTFQAGGAYGTNRTQTISLMEGLSSIGAAITTTTTPTQLVIPAPPAYHYLHGAAFSASLNNGQVIDLASEGVLSYQLQMQQSIQWESLPGIDQFMIANDVNSGAYMGTVFRGKRTLVPTIKMYLDSDLDEYYWTRKNLEITSLTITTKGQKIGATAYQYETEIKVPVSKQSSLMIDTESDRGAKTITLLPTKDPVSLGIVTARIRNGTATLV